MRDLRLLTAAVAMAIVLTACAAEPPPSLTRFSHPSTLAGTTWRLLTIGRQSVPSGPDLTLEFDGDRISGNGGCNSFGGQFTYEPTTGSFAKSGLLSTMRACVEAARNDVEKAYLSTLQGVDRADVDSAGRLVLSGPGTELVFEVGPREVGVPIDASPSGSNAP